MLMILSCDCEKRSLLECRAFSLPEIALPVDNTTELSDF